MVKTVKFINGAFFGVCMSLESIVCRVRSSVFVASAMLGMCYSQSTILTGKVTDHQSVGLSGKNVAIYLNGSAEGIAALTNSDGVYGVSVLGVELENWPSGYSLSNNYPNPFNPSTVFDVTVPKYSHVEIEVYDLLGQSFGNVFDDYVLPGTTPVTVHLDGVSEGVYFAKVLLDEKYSDVKKMLFLHGAPHASSSSGVVRPVFRKQNAAFVDSVVVSGRSILPKTSVLGFTVVGDSMDLGTVVVDPAFNVDGQVISTIRYALPNNHVPDVEVVIDGYRTFADGLGNFSLQVPVGDSLRKMDIVDPSIWERKKKIYIHSDTSNVIEDVLTKEDFPDSVMSFFNKISSRDGFGGGDVLRRFVNPPIFYIVADTTQDWDREFFFIWHDFIRGGLNDVMKGRKYPEGFLKDVVTEVGMNPPPNPTWGYYVIKTSDQYGNAVAVTNTNSPNVFDIQYGETIIGMYPEPMSFLYMANLLGHELASGLVYMPRRSNDLQSWYNLPVHSNIPSQTDTLMLRAVFSRNTGWDMNDVDWERSPKNPFGDP